MENNEVARRIKKIEERVGVIEERKAPRYASDIAFIEQVIERWFKVQKVRDAKERVEPPCTTFTPNPDIKEDFCLNCKQHAKYHPFGVETW